MNKFIRLKYERNVKSSLRFTSFLIGDWENLLFLAFASNLERIKFVEIALFRFSFSMISHLIASCVPILVRKHITQDFWLEIQRNKKKEKQKTSEVQSIASNYKNMAHFGMWNLK